MSESNSTRKFPVVPPGSLWTVLSYAGQPKGSRHRWFCRCSCGVEKSVDAGHLVSGKSNNCGHLRKERFNSRTHGKSRTKEYRVWKGMIERCTYKKHKGYKNYGGRGISVAESWLNSFEKFIEDMGPRPSESHSVERRDNNGNYEPGNCYWATSLEQGSNRRDNRNITSDGVTKTLQEWARTTGMKRENIARRLNAGMSPEEALSRPVMVVNRDGIEFDGFIRSVDEWSRITGIGSSTIHQRLKAYGWSVEKALTTPVRSCPKKTS